MLVDEDRPPFPFPFPASRQAQRHAAQQSVASHRVCVSSVPQKQVNWCTHIAQVEPRFMGGTGRLAFFLTASSRVLSYCCSGPVCKTTESHASVSSSSGALEMSSSTSAELRDVADLAFRRRCRSQFLWQCTATWCGEHRCDSLVRRKPMYEKIWSRTQKIG